MRPDALPAVTLPPFLKTAGRAASCSMLVWRGYSSTAKTSGGPLRAGTSTGTISSSNRPDSMAAKARSWLRSA